MQAAHRVAKNTLILYGRMAITVFISLYSTRLVLAALGVADFGLFNVVGGVISMLGFLNASMAAATQRFISFAQGAGDLEKVKRIFNMSSLLHWGIAILVFIVLEIAGYFFFNGILNIAPDRVGVAKLIYQFMVVSTIFTVVSVPYEAVITSHENMMVYAILGIVEAFLKLAIAFYITYSTYDHLVLYGLLMAILSIFLLIMKRVYCHRNYPECDLDIKNNYDLSLLKEVSEFAGWNLLGTFTSMMAYYGQGVLINFFFGTTANASQAIAAQISGQLGVFAVTLTKALNPVIDKSEGSAEREKLLKVTYFGTKVSFFLISFLYIPFLIEMPFILSVWLKNIPQNTIVFCSLLLCRNLIEQFYILLGSAINAVGNIRYFQFYSSIINLLSFVVTLILFYIGFPAYSSYLVFIIFSLAQLINVLICSKKYLKLSILDFYNEVIKRCTLALLLTLAFVTAFKYFFIEEGLSRFITIFFIGSAAYIFLFYKTILSKNQRDHMNSFKFFLYINR